jgi:hypothetical protein
VVAAQKFTPQMTRTLEYLNAAVQVGRYHLVHMIHFHGEEMTAYAAQSVGLPSSQRRASAKAALGEASFLTGIEDAAYREALSDIFDSCRALGLTFEWGVRGTPIRLPTPDRSEPLSVGWIFGGVPSWSGLTHLTLGYDSSSARHTPSVHGALAVYLDQLVRIPGASTVRSKGLKAYTWVPPQVTASRTQIVEALEGLVAAASGAEADEPSTASSS